MWPPASITVATYNNVVRCIFALNVNRMSESEHEGYSSYRLQAGIYKRLQYTHDKALLRYWHLHSGCVSSIVPRAMLAVPNIMAIM